MQQPIANDSVNAQAIIGNDATDGSGTIAVGGATQVLFAANNKRMGLFVQNISAGDLWINDLGAAAAAQPSIKIPAGATFQTPLNWSPRTAISIWGATLAQAFVARQF